MNSMNVGELKRIIDGDEWDIYYDSVGCMYVVVAGDMVKPGFRSEEVAWLWMDHVRNELCGFDEHIEIPIDDVETMFMSGAVIVGCECA